MTIRISSEFIGDYFVAVEHPTKGCGLVKIGTAETVNDSGKWYVTASGLDKSGYLSRWIISQYETEDEAIRATNALNREPPTANRHAKRMIDAFPYLLDSCQSALRVLRTIDYSTERRPDAADAIYQLSTAISGHQPCSSDKMQVLANRGSLESAYWVDADSAR